MERANSLHSVIHLDDISITLYCAMLNVSTNVEFEVLVPMCVKKVIWCEKETQLKTMVKEVVMDYLKHYSEYFKRVLKEIFYISDG
jgi:hypothetical protein